MPTRNPLWLMDGATGLVSAEDARLGEAAVWAPGSSGVLARSGVVATTGIPLRVHQTVTASGSLLVEAGACVIQGTSSATQGSYTASLDSQLTVAYLASYPADALARKDLIVARINDKAYVGSAASFTIEVVKGTASGSPVDPAVPASCLVLARINLAGSATAVTDAVIDDLRTYTVTRGGLLPVLASARPGVPYQGMAIYETDTQKSLVWNGVAWVTPASAIVAGSVASTSDPAATSGTTVKTLVTLNVTCDGISPLELDFSWYGMAFTVAADRYEIAIKVDGTAVNRRVIYAADATYVMEGGNLRALTTPAAGARVITATIVRVAGTGTADLVAASDAPLLLTAKQFV